MEEGGVAEGKLQVELGVLKGHLLEREDFFNDLLVGEDLVVFLALLSIHR